MAITTHHSPDTAPAPQGDREERAGKPSEKQRRNRRGLMAGIAAATALVGGTIGVAMNGGGDAEEVKAEAPIATAPAQPTTEAPAPTTTQPTTETTVKNGLDYNYADAPTELWGDTIAIGFSWGSGFERMANPAPNAELVAYSEAQIDEFIDGYQSPEVEGYGATIDYGTSVSFSSTYQNAGTGETVVVRELWLNPAVQHDQVANRTTYFAQGANETGEIETRAITVENWGQTGAQSSLGEGSLLRVDHYNVYAGEILSGYNPPHEPSANNPWHSAEGYPYPLESPDANKMTVAATPVLVDSASLIDVLNPHFVEYMDLANETLLDAAYTPKKGDL